MRVTHYFNADFESDFSTSNVVSVPRRSVRSLSRLSGTREDREGCLIPDFCSFSLARRSLLSRRSSVKENGGDPEALLHPV